MDYIAPLNKPATEADPRPAYDDGNLAAGLRGSFPSGKVFENLQKELLAVIEGAGLTAAGNNLGQLLQAIQILAAGAGGEAAVFAYNPVYPHVTVNGGVVSISSSNGQVVVNTGQSFIHRGGTLYSLDDFDSGERTFATVAGKTYHLRWRYNAGAPTLTLTDVTDGTYNPAAKAETDATFDSGFDDMLIARVVTDGANTPTVTALKNLHQFPVTIFEKTSKESQTSGVWTGLPILTEAINWARTPQPAIVSFDVDNSLGLEAAAVVASSASRYSVSASAYGYGGIGTGSTIYISGAIKIAVRD